MVILSEILDIKDSFLINTLKKRNLMLLSYDLHLHILRENTFPLEFSQPQPHKERGILAGGKIGNSEAQGIQEEKRQVGLYSLPPER